MSLWGRGEPPASSGARRHQYFLNSKVFPQTAAMNTKREEMKRRGHVDVDKDVDAGRNAHQAGKNEARSGRGQEEEKGMKEEGPENGVM